MRISDWSSDVCSSDLFTTTASYYGKWTDFGPDLANDQTGGAEILVDAEISYRFTNNFTLAAGGSNIFNNYPDREMRAGQIGNGFKYLRFSPKIGRASCRERVCQAV